MSTTEGRKSSSFRKRESGEIADLHLSLFHRIDHDEVLVRFEGVDHLLEILARLHEEHAVISGFGVHAYIQKGMETRRGYHLHIGEIHDHAAFLRVEVYQAFKAFGIGDGKVSVKMNDLHPFLVLDRIVQIHVSHVLRIT